MKQRYSERLRERNSPNFVSWINNQVVQLDI